MSENFSVAITEFLKSPSVNPDTFRKHRTNRIRLRIPVEYSPEFSIP